MYRMMSFVLAGVLVTAGVAAAQAPPDSAIERILRERVESGGSTGLVAGVIDADGTKRIVAYGTQGEGGPPLDGHSVFEIGSITKVFTATLLADMVERGVVKLDDPVAKYLPPEVDVPSRGGRQITLVDLSTQTSGLPRMPSNFRPSDPSNPYADYTVQQMYDFLSSYELTRDIGSQYEYSNLGVGLLGHALSRAAGMSYGALVRERILEPLGMEHTAIELTPEMRAHLAPGHDASGNVVPNWDLPAFAGAGALRSDAEDMLKFLAANLDPPATELGRAIAATHVSRKPTGQPNLSIALNWHILAVSGDSIVWHNGGTGGYRTFIGFDPAKGVGAVVLSDMSVGADDIGMHLIEPELPLQPPPERVEHTEITLAPDILQRYTGDYELAPEFHIVVTLEDGKLFAQPTGQQRFQLHPESETGFFVKEVEATVTFTEEGGRVTGMVLHQNGRDMHGRRIR